MIHIAASYGFSSYVMLKKLNIYIMFDDVVTVDGIALSSPVPYVLRLNNSARYNKQQQPWQRTAKRA